MGHAVIGAGAAGDEDTLGGFDASGSTPRRFAALSRRHRAFNARVDEEIAQDVIERCADVLSREPRWMGEAPRGAEQHVGLRRGCELTGHRL